MPDEVPKTPVATVLMGGTEGQSTPNSTGWLPHGHLNVDVTLPKMWSLTTIVRVSIRSNEQGNQVMSADQNKSGLHSMVANHFHAGTPGSNVHLSDFTNVKKTGTKKYVYVPCKNQRIGSR